jgi:hypothetical protein
MTKQSMAKLSMTKQSWMWHAGAAALAGALALAAAGCSSSLGSNSASGNDASSGPLARFMEKPVPITLPAGTAIPVTLDEAISSGQQRPGDSFDATVADAVEVNGKTVIPKGARAKGRVVDARGSGHLKTVAHLEVALESVEVGGKSVPVETESLNFSGSNHDKRNAVLIGGGTGVGALIGGLSGGGKGALIGGALGAGAGTAGAAATGKKDIALAPETSLTFRLTQAVTVESKS